MSLVVPFVGSERNAMGRLSLVILEKGSTHNHEIDMNCGCLQEIENGKALQLCLRKLRSKIKQTLALWTLGTVLLNRACVVTFT